MYEGKIISYHRKMAGFTQNELGKEICSTTHVSKIERGVTEYSPEITSLLAERLNIDLENEVQKVVTVKEKLEQFHQMIISQKFQRASELQQELQNNKYISIFGFDIRYKLLTLLFLIKNKSESHIIKQHIKKLPENSQKLPAFEYNLYKHVLGTYYHTMNKYTQAIQTLDKVKVDAYSNPLIYYDLAAANYYKNLPVLSYHYAEKSLQLYKQTNNLLGIMDTKNLMIIQSETDHHDFDGIAKEYKKLIHICNLCRVPEKKGKILHNFAYENFKRRRYHEANHLYQAAMDLSTKTDFYLLSLEGYIWSLYEGRMESKTKIVEYIEKGISVARNNNAKMYIILLTLYKYEILEHTAAYMDFLQNEAKDYFKANGYDALGKQVEMELLKHFIRTKDKEKVLMYGEHLVNCTKVGGSSLSRLRGQNTERTLSIKPYVIL